MRGVMRRVLGAVLVVMTLSGCGVVTKEAEVITIERQEAVNAWAKVKLAYLRAVAIVDLACRTGQWSREQCTAAWALHQEALKIGAEVESKLMTPESELNWGKIMRILEIAVEMLT